MATGSNAPSDWLRPWVEEVPAGRALDLGAGSGETARWLAKRGFSVEAVERDPQPLLTLQRTAEAEPQIRVIAAGIEDLLIEAGRYELILALAVLHFLKPSDLWNLADEVRKGLRPGGRMAAEVLTVDDPGFHWYRRQDRREVEPNTFEMEGMAGWIHYFEPGELVRVFAGLETLTYEEVRTVDPDAEPSYRVGARLVARKENPQG